MSDKRKAKLDYLIEKREALRNNDVSKVERLETGRRVSSKKPSMNAVYIDIALAVFCFVTVVLSPLGLFFAATSIFKYSQHKKGGN